MVRAALVSVWWALMPALVLAEVTKIDITSRADVLAGKPFAAVGPYEMLRGKAYFAIDPQNPRNRIIVDLDKAPKNAQGAVEFSADILIIKPKDSTKGNGVLLFDVVNRGNFRLLSVFNRAATSDDQSTEEHFGDGLLMREGYTLVAVGWQFDARGRIAMKAPDRDRQWQTDHRMAQAVVHPGQLRARFRVRQRKQHARVSAARSEQPGLSTD